MIRNAIEKNVPTGCPLGPTILMQLLHDDWSPDHAYACGIAKQGATPRQDSLQTQPISRLIHC